MSFKGLNASSDERGTPLGEGLFSLDVLETIEITSKNPKTAGQKFFLAKFKVLESDNKEETPIGAERTWMTACDEMGFKRLKSFLINAVGAANSGEPVDLEAIAEEAVTQQGLKGLKLSAEGRKKVSKNGKPYVEIKFFQA